MEYGKWDSSKKVGDAIEKVLDEHSMSGASEVASRLMGLALEIQKHMGAEVLELRIENSKLRSWIGGALVLLDSEIDDHLAEMNNNDVSRET